MAYCLVERDLEKAKLSFLSGSTYLPMSLSEHKFCRPRSFPVTQLIRQFRRRNWQQRPRARPWWWSYPTRRPMTPTKTTPSPAMTSRRRRTRSPKTELKKCFRNWRRKFRLRCHLDLKVLFFSLTYSEYLDNPTHLMLFRSRQIKAAKHSLIKLAFL